MKEHSHEKRQSDDEAERKTAPRAPHRRLSQPRQKQREQEDDGEGPPGATLGQAVPSPLRPVAREKPTARRSRVTARSSGSVRVPPMTVRKLVSPSQRGTT